MNTPLTARYCHTLPFGAELMNDSHTRFRLWAPDQQQVQLIIPGLTPVTLHRDHGGWFEGVVNCGAGTLYQYRLESNLLVPDPASRLQAGDVHDPSVVCDPREFRWQHIEWRGRPWQEMVIYELHVGAAGGFEGVTKQLPELAEIGITAIELMPIADFSGTRNWGYDGVLPFAPDRCYGSPTQLKQLIDTAHGLGLCVYLDVVYNHFGPDGNYLPHYASPFFDAHKESPWGAAIDFSLAVVRGFFTENVLYWLLEYRFDGLRFDAVHQIGDPGWLDEMAAAVRARVEPDRQIHLMLENEHNQAAHLERDFDAQWNDDAHNALHVLLTDEHDSYYGDFAQQPAELLARCLAEGFAFQGDVADRQQRTRGTPSAHLPPHAFVFFLQNHDQIGNRAFGERLTTLIDDDNLRAAIALQLLTPQIPLIFMGEEWGSHTPFLFFTDFDADLAQVVRDGRRQEFAALPAFASPELRKKIPDPNAMLTFASSIPGRDMQKPETHDMLALYRELLTLRRQHISPALAECCSRGARAVANRAIIASWRLGNGAVLTIAVNFGSDDIQLDARAEVGPLLFDSRTHLENSQQEQQHNNALSSPLPLSSYLPLSSHLPRYLPAHTTLAYLKNKNPELNDQYEQQEQHEPRQYEPAP